MKGVPGKIGEFLVLGGARPEFPSCIGDMDPKKWGACLELSQQGDALPFQAAEGQQFFQDPHPAPGVVDAIAVVAFFGVAAFGFAW